MPPRQSGRGAAAAQPALEAPGLLSLPEPLLVRVLSLLDDDAERSVEGVALWLYLRVPQPLTVSEPSLQGAGGQRLPGPPRRDSRA